MENIHIKKSFDSITLRYNWLNSKDDYGNLYIKILNLKNEEKNKLQLKYVENKLNQIKLNIKDIEKNLLVENKKDINNCKIYRFEAKLIDNLEIEKDNIYDYYFYENKLYKFENDKLEIINDISENDILLLENKELWKYKNKKWEFTKEYSNYNKIEYLCKFKNIKLEELNLDSLDCIYRKDFGCLSKSNLRYKLKLEEYNNLKNLFENLYERLKSNKKLNDIQNNIKNYIKKYNFSDNTSNERFKNQILI